VPVIYPGLFLVIKQFPEHRDVVRRLYSSDDPFQSLCENYQQCSDALRYWTDAKDKNTPERQQEYQALLSELKKEILLYCSDDSDDKHGGLIPEQIDL